ncbi:MAG: hypothetical protein IIW24_03545 [Lachnospiraceae bacterium]|nr:hypothetical protein [Lachnospiraceae bacterium]
MAKRSDPFMNGRNEGMLYAYNFAREHGLDALEEEIKLRRLTNLPTKVSTKAMNECVINIKNNVVDTFVILLVSTLRDELGFGEKRIQRVIDRFNQKAECIGENYVTWQDLIDDIREDLGFELAIRKNDKDVRC